MKNKTELWIHNLSSIKGYAIETKKDADLVDNNMYTTQTSKYMSKIIELVDNMNMKIRDIRDEEKNEH